MARDIFSLIPLRQLALFGNGFRLRCESYGSYQRKRLLAKDHRSRVLNALAFEYGSTGQSPTISRQVSNITEHLPFMVDLHMEVKKYNMYVHTQTPLMNTLNKLML